MYLIEITKRSMCNIDMTYRQVWVITCGIVRRRGPLFGYALLAGSRLLEEHVRIYPL